ncbi:MAG: hypothetical protein L0220_06555 [Acidobacteria bacterium]|nr:hypothetical protein [Acidobacteriota bacterium]
MQTEIPEIKTRKSLPISALLFGSIGLLELGWVLMENIEASPCGKPLTQHYFSIPSLLGFSLGLINQAQYYEIHSRFATLPLWMNLRRAE